MYVGHRSIWAQRMSPPSWGKYDRNAFSRWDIVGSQGWVTESQGASWGFWWR